jgi:hypothetical protein
MSETEESNSFFYKFIQMAYEHVNSFSLDSVQGSPELFHLMRHRIESVFEDAWNDEVNYSENWRLDVFREWFQQSVGRTSTRMLNGNLDDFKFEDEQLNQAIQAFSEAGFPDWLRRFEADQDRWGRFGLDCYATYLPLHFFFDGDGYSKKWGIYIAEEGVQRIAAKLFEATRDWQKDEELLWVRLQKIALEILLRHELEHFKIESFALNAELFLKEPVYVPYLMQIYARTYPYNECLEEAAANTTVLDSRRLDKMFKDIFREIESNKWRILLIKTLFDGQPPCYRNIYLREGWPKDEDKFKQFQAGCSRKTHEDNNIRRRGMNYLCNQIIAQAQSNREIPQENIPFFAFMPDNYFLRAENLVPIHIVQSLNPDECMLGVAVPNERQFISFIECFGFFRDRTTDHQIWKSPYFKDALIVDIHDGELNFRSYKSSLVTLGMTMAEYQRYHAMDKKGQKKFVQQKLENRPSFFETLI